jgi:hypothetical protein
MTKFAVISYKSRSDWFLTESTHTIGCNRSLSRDTIVFVVLQSNGATLLGYCGHIGSKMAEPLWAYESLKRNTYSCETPQLLGDLNEFCAKTKTHPKIFRSSKIYGYPKRCYAPDFKTIYDFIQNRNNI